MGLPRNREEMLAAQYVCLDEHAACRSCTAPIEIWRTTNRILMPFDPPTSSFPNNGRAIPHFNTCANRKADAGASTPSPDGPKVVSSFERSMRECDVSTASGRSKARLVLVIHDDGILWQVRNGISPDDVQHEAITAADAIRRELVDRQTTKPREQVEQTR